MCVDRKKIWVSIDETADITCRFVANVIIGALEENGSGKIFLLNVEELEKTNHSTVFKLFDKSMNILWPDGVKHDDELLFLTDGVPCMIKTTSSIKTLNPKMIHATCLACRLHRVAETVRILNPKVDKIIANVKNCLKKKTPSRIQIFRDICTLLPLPPEPINQVGCLRGFKLLFIIVYIYRDCTKIH